jgi:hypothetical protein
VDAEHPLWSFKSVVKSKVGCLSRKFVWYDIFKSNISTIAESKAENSHLDKTFGSLGNKPESLTMKDRLQIMSTDTGRMIRKNWVQFG